MTLDELNKLDLKTLADWPLATKLAALSLLCVAIVAAGWWFDWRGGMETLDAAQQKETELRGVFTTKKNQAVNLEAYQEAVGRHRTGLRRAVETVAQQTGNGCADYRH